LSTFPPLFGFQLKSLNLKIFAIETGFSTQSRKGAKIQRIILKISPLRPCSFAPLR
jgi:hypothetical protein